MDKLDITIGEGGYIKPETVRTPTVKFSVLDIKEETETIVGFCMHKNPTLDFSSNIYHVHPGLKEAVTGITDEQQFYDLSEKYVTDYIEKNKTEIDNAVKNFQEIWDQIGPRVLAALSEDFETDFPDSVAEISARISINPMCPRYLDKWAFNLFYLFQENSVKSVCIHEIIHFLYFKKWNEVFPDADDKNFNGFNPEWILSEILVHTIMNNNIVIQEIVKNEKSKVYKEWQGILIDGKTLDEHFDVYYKERQSGQISFADFLKKSWDEYQKQRDFIEGRIRG